MERLTKQNIQNDGTILYSSQYDCRLLRCETNQKLGKLEDLEEQIGMPLLDLFNVLGTDVYFIKNNEIRCDTVKDIEFVNGCFNLTYWTDFGCDIEVVTNDFNKTWFLTREEAEKKLEELKNG